MGRSPNSVAIWLAALVGSVATVAFGQSSPVLTGAAAYGDWRSDAPGLRRKISPADMPPPYATASANNGLAVVARPPDAWPEAPPGFVVELLDTNLNNPRLIRVSPSGDLFVAESQPGRIRVLRAAQSGEEARDPDFREGSQSAIWDRLLATGIKPALPLCREHRQRGPVSLSHGQSSALRPSRDSCRRAAAGRALDARRRLLQRWRPHVC